MALLLSSLLVTGSVFPQAQPASVTGIVVDPFGALIPHATIDVHPAAGNEIKTTTDDNGQFRLNLPPGRYTVTATQTGFVAQDRQLDVTAQSHHIAFTLKVDVPGLPPHTDLTENLPIPGSSSPVQIIYGDAADRRESDTWLLFTGHHAHTDAIILTYKNLTVWADQVRVRKNPLRIEALSKVAPVRLDEPPTPLKIGKSVTLTFSGDDYKLEFTKCHGEPSCR